MIRVLILYPRTNNDVFDYEYYVNHHIELVKKTLEPFLVEIDKGITNSKGSQSPYHVITHMHFKTKNELISKYQESGKVLEADKEKFTNIQTITQISEIIG